MARKSAAVMEKPVVVDGCKHHWLIEPAYGLTSIGICKYCGAKKEFLNVILDEVEDKKTGKVDIPELSAEDAIDDSAEDDSDE
jgi:hypothetical protein